MKRLIYLTSLLVIASMLLSACGTEEVTRVVTEIETVIEKETVVQEKEVVVTAVPEPTADPRQGGKLTLAWPSSELELDPNLTWSGYDYSIGMMIYPTLYRTDGNGDVVPFLAESHEVSEDGTTWIFHLRPDFKFADGTPLTAEDVKYSFERIGSEESLQNWVWADTGITEEGGIEVIDDHTVQFNLAKPYMPFLAYTSGYYAVIFPKAPLEEQGAEEFFKMPVSGGIWMVTEFDRTSHITVVPNPYQNVYPQPFLDEIEMRVYPDAATRMLALQAGELDIALGIENAQVGAVSAMPGLDIVQFPMTNLTFIMLNHANPPMDDVNFRLALNHATDRETLIEKVMFGLAKPATSYQPAGVPMMDETLPGYEFDLELAKEYLAKSAYPDGATFELMTFSGREDFLSITTALEAMWEELPGVEVDIQQYEPAVLRDKRNEGDYWAVPGGILCDTPDSDQIGIFLILWPVHNADVSEVEPLILEAQSETDLERRAELYRQIQIWDHETAFIVPLTTGNSIWGIKENVEGFVVNSYLNPMMHEVWLRK